MMIREDKIKRIVKLENLLVWYKYQGDTNKYQGELADDLVNELKWWKKVIEAEPLGQLKGNGKINK